MNRGRRPLGQRPERRAQFSEQRLRLVGQMLRRRLRIDLDRITEGGKQTTGAYEKAWR